MMHAQRRVLVPIVTGLVLAVAALAEAVRLREPGLGVVLAAAVAAGLAALVSARSRTAVALRADLAAWAERTCAATGEPPERLVDRAVSAYRSQLDATGTTDASAAPEGVAGDG